MRKSLLGQLECYAFARACCETNELYVDADAEVFVEFVVCVVDQQREDDAEHEAASQTQAGV